MEVAKRKRYHVTIEGNGKTEQNVIIAYDNLEMFFRVHKLYNHLLIDNKGNKTGKISYKETELG